MVRVIAATFALTLATQAAAFAPTTAGSARMATDLSATKMQEAKTIISNLTKDNFSESLKTVEPFLLNDAGVTIYKKSLRRIAVSAKSFGVEVPADFAKAAKATEKRRSKQNTFIEGKEAERKEAEAAAAEEAAAAAAAAAEEAAAAAAAEAPEEAAEEA